jgi:uncharacterized membrane protein
MNPTTLITEKKAIDKLFFVSMFIKAAGGIVEVFTGIASLFLTTNEVLHATQLLVQGKLDADPDDFLANYILDLAARFTPGATNLFLFWYLLGHGVINLFLVVMLLRKKMWAYPLSLTIFGIFVAYEGWQVYVSHSPLVAAFTVFDLAVIWLVWREYRYVRRKHHHTS